MDIGDAVFTDLTHYTFTIDAVPEWPGGSTAIPTDRDDESEEYFALYLTLTLLWMAFSFMVGTWLEHWDVHRLSHKGVVVIFGIIAGVLVRYMGSGMSAVGARGACER